MEDRILREREVRQIVPQARPTLYKRMRANKFPKQVRYGARSVGWLHSEVMAWVRKQADARDHEEMADQAA